MVKVNGLTKYYGDKVAIDNVSFSIESGQVVGLLGLNGAGKSTTMNILTGYISATSGEVFIDGHDIADSGGKAKRVTGYLPEQPAFYPEMRVNEHLDFVCGLKGVTKQKRDREKHIAVICERVGISDMRDRMVRNLSKGYRQRVGFAQALIGDPKVIILDEPTVGLDPSQLIGIRKLIRDSGKGSAVIVSSHILSEIQAVCDRVIVMNAGRVIADDTPARLVGGDKSNHKFKLNIQGDPAAVKAALGLVENVESVRQLSQTEQGAYDYAVTSRVDADIRADIFRALAKADLPLLATYSAGLSLEDVFLSLIGDKSGAGGKTQ